VGELATAVQTHIRDALAERRPSVTWETEYRVAGTPVDIAGRRDGQRYLVELEWRRADPADNTAKLFRHLVEGKLDAGRVAVFQVFSGYYDLTRGGVSSKRENAEFVGRVAADAVERLAYTPVEFDLDPPKRGGTLPENWEPAADVVVAALCDDIESE
jgi:hypothetical protein